MFERSMWRYREPRSFRVILYDIGHLITTARVVCQSMGIDSFVGDGFEDKEVSKILKLKNFYEEPFSFIAIS